MIITHRWSAADQRWNDHPRWCEAPGSMPPTYDEFQSRWVPKHSEGLRSSKWIGSSVCRFLCWFFHFDLVINDCRYFLFQMSQKTSVIHRTYLYLFVGFASSDVIDGTPRYPEGLFSKSFVVNHWSCIFGIGACISERTIIQKAWYFSNRQMEEEKR